LKIENITCSKCGSKYIQTYTGVLMKDNVTIKGEVRSEQLYSWNEAKIWEAKFIEKHENLFKG